jgi:hypothetical protein
MARFGVRSGSVAVYARLDERTYPNKIKVTDAQLKAVNLHRHTFHPDWNCTIRPRNG